MKSTTLYNKMKSDGYGYRRCATLLNKKYGSEIHYFDIFYFVHRAWSKIGKGRRAIIRQFFIFKGWLPTPAKRKPPVCRRCGLKYPTRKMTIARRSHNNKRSTKYSHHK